MERREGVREREGEKKSEGEGDLMRQRGQDGQQGTTFGKGRCIDGGNEWDDDQQRACVFHVHVCM